MLTLPDDTELHAFKAGSLHEQAIAYSKMKFEAKASFDMIYQSAKVLDAAMVGYLAAQEGGTK